MADIISAPRGSSFVRIIWYWAPVLMTLGVMYYFSTDSLSSSHTQSIFDKIFLRFKPNASKHTLELMNHFIRKSAHVIEYAALGALLFRALRGDNQFRWRLRWAVYALIFTASWALLDEFHQSLTRSREASIWDVLLDSSGALLGLTLIGLYVRRGQATRSSWTRKPWRRTMDGEPLE